MAQPHIAFRRLSNGHATSAAGGLSARVEQPAARGLSALILPLRRPSRGGRPRRICSDVFGSPDPLLQPANPGEDLFTPSEWTALARALRLTPRELITAQHTLAGRTAHEIADLLHVEPRTVKFHRRNLHTKLRVKDCLGMVARLVRVQRGLIVQQSRDGQPCQQSPERFSEPCP